MKLVVSNPMPDVIKDSVLDFALQYAALGWYVFPIRPLDEKGVCTCKDGEHCKNPGKHPHSGLVKRGQDDSTTDEKLIRKWFGLCPDAYIAVHLARSGLCAVDVDPRNGGYLTLEELEDKHGAILTDVVQLSGGGGEHRVFLKPDDIQSLPGKLGKGIDLKLNGYIVVEPSGHVSGRQYGWEGSSSPLDGCAPSPLPDWIRGMAFNAPVDGKDTYQFSSRYVTDNQIEDLRAALLFIDADDRDQWIRMGHALKTIGAVGLELWTEYSKKSDKFNAFDQHKKWLSFKTTSLNIETVFFDGKQAGWSGMPSAPVFSEADIEAMKQAAKLRKEPVKAAVSAEFTAPTTLPVKQLAEVSDWLSGLFESPTEAISCAGAVALASVLTGRLYRSEGKSNWTALLMAVSGSSGIGKNYIKVGIERALYAAGMGNLVSGDFYTHQTAVYSQLKKKPCHISISDEFGDNFHEARKSNNANKLTVFKTLKKTYSDVNHMYQCESRSDITGRNSGDTEPVMNPSLTLLGLTTPVQLYSEIKTQHIESGLINRFIIVNIDDNEPKTMVTNDTPPGEQLLDWMRQVRRLPESALQCLYSQAPTPVLVPFSPAALSLFDKAQQDQNAISTRLKDFNLDVMPRRWRESAMRIATAFAACRAPDSPLIDEELAHWAIQYVFGHGLATIDALLEHMGDNDYQTQSSQLLAFIANSQNGVQNQALARKFRSIKKREREEILAHLQEAELVYQEKEDVDGKKGRPGIIWRAF